MGLFATEEEEAEKKRLREEEKRRLREAAEKREEEKRRLREEGEKREHDAFVAANGERFCKAFCGLEKDLMPYEGVINLFLKQYPEYKIVAMTSGVTYAGRTIMCYFEKIK